MANEASQSIYIPPFPASTTIAVYDADGTFAVDANNLVTAGTLATGLTDEAGSALANPYAAPAEAEMLHRLPTGQYHVVIGGTGSAEDTTFRGNNGGKAAVLWFQSHLDTEAMTQAQAEDSASTVKRLTTGQRIWQAVIAWAAKAASVFSGILSGYSEAPETLSFSSGVASLAVDTCKNVQQATLTQNSVINPTGTPVNFKPIDIFLTHSGGAWTLGLGPSGSETDLALEGASGETEVISIVYNGSNYLVFRAGVVDVTI